MNLLNVSSLCMVINMSEIDTSKLTKYGNSIVDSSHALNEEIQKLYDRIINIPTKTGEWQGESALEFVRKVKKDKIEVLKTRKKIYNCGNALLKISENYEKGILSLFKR